MGLMESVKERLSIFNGLYDIIRIVNPMSNKVLIDKDNKVIETNNLCYGFWERNEVCENCVTKRAYLENNTFFKLEKKKEKIYLITASPIVYNGETYIIEMLKDISQYMGVVAVNDFGNFSTRIDINNINNKLFKDTLTGLYNREYFNSRLQQDINFIKDEYLKVSMTLIDIDFFKNINDTYGHIIGDKLLRDISEVLRENVKPEKEWVTRLGGEEFIIISEGIYRNEALKNAERIRQSIESTVFKYGDVLLNVTISAGVYELKSDDSIESALVKVDEKMYEAKNSGRNLVCI